jgi:peptidyl-prolyl cis-trans isomerase C
MFSIKVNKLQPTVMALICIASMGVAHAAPPATPAAEADAKASLVQPFVTVNGVAQSNAKAELLLREQIARGAQLTPELRASVRDTLINIALMEQQARGAGLDKDPLAQAQIELAKQNVLSQAWQRKMMLESPSTDAQLQAEYELQIAQLGNKEFLVRQLLVNDESVAKLLIEKLQAGSQIADLAKEYSRDASTQNRGGLLDWALPFNFLPPLANVVPKLDKGKFTPQAVRSQLGWHILQVEDTRPFKTPSFEELKPQLVQILARRKIDARLKTLRDTAKLQ